METNWSFVFSPVFLQCEVTHVFSTNDFLRVRILAPLRSDKFMKKMHVRRMISVLFYFYHKTLVMAHRSLVYFAIQYIFLRPRMYIYNSWFYDILHSYLRHINMVQYILKDYICLIETLFWLLDHSRKSYKTISVICYISISLLGTHQGPW